MSAGKVLLVGGAAVALGLLFLNKASASTTSRMPAGWDEDPPGSEHTSLPAGMMGLQFPVERVMWRNDPTGTPGVSTLLSADANDWAYLFTPDATGLPQVMNMGAGSNSKVIAKAAGVQGL